MISAMELTDKEKEMMRSIGKRAYREMLSKLGKGDVKRGQKKLAEIAAEQGHHGIEGGRPSVYDKPCKKAGRETARHRFDKHGVCKFCGQQKLTPQA